MNREHILQASWLLSMRQGSNGLSLKSFVVWIWLAGSSFEGTFEVTACKIVDFVRGAASFLNYPSQRVLCSEWILTPVLMGLVSSPCEELHHMYSFWKFCLENIISSSATTIPRLCAPCSGALETQKYMPESLLPEAWTWADRQLYCRSGQGWSRDLFRKSGWEFQAFQVFL